MKKQTKFELIGLAVAIAFGFLMSFLFPELDSFSAAVGMVMIWLYFIIRNLGREEK